jgi:hypothetical protein
LKNEVPLYDFSKWIRFTHFFWEYEEHAEH